MERNISPGQNTWNKSEGSSAVKHYGESLASQFI